jgi:hypothetical protein
MHSPSPASFPPNKSFKPTPCRGFVETYRLAGNTGSHPPRSARLNSGVRRLKAFGSCIVSALRVVRGHVASSVKSAVRAHTSHALRWPASEAAIVICGSSASSDTIGCRSARRAHAFLLRPSASAPGLHLHQHPVRLTIRSSRPHVVASATCFCATLARVRRPATGRLNSGVRRQKSV